MQSYLFIGCEQLQTGLPQLFSHFVLLRPYVTLLRLYVRLTIAHECRLRLQHALADGNMLLEWSLGPKAPEPLPPHLWLPHGFWAHRHCPAKAIAEDLSRLSFCDVILGNMKQIMKHCHLRIKTNIAMCTMQSGASVWTLLEFRCTQSQASSISRAPPCNLANV